LKDQYGQEFVDAEVVAKLSGNSIYVTANGKNDDDVSNGLAQIAEMNFGEGNFDLKSRTVIHHSEGLNPTPFSASITAVTSGAGKATKAATDFINEVVADTNKKNDEEEAKKAGIMVAQARTLDVLNKIGLNKTAVSNLESKPVPSAADIICKKGINREH
jgi:hypothetical protein